MSAEFFTAEWQLEDWIAELIGESVNDYLVHVAIEEGVLEENHIVVSCPGLTPLEPYIPGHFAADVVVSICTMVDSVREMTAREAHKATCLAVRNLIWTDDVHSGASLDGGLNVEFVQWGQTENEVAGRYILTRHHLTVSHASGND